MHYSGIKKPPLKRVVGDGTSSTIHMPDTGRVVLLDRNTDHESISRDPGQSLSHMRIKTDKARIDGGKS